MVIGVARKEKALGSVKVETLPALKLFETYLQKNRLLVFFPEEPSQRMAIKVQKEWTERVFNTSPELRPPVRWQTSASGGDHILAKELRSLDRGELGSSANSVRIFAAVPWHASNRVHEFCSSHVRCRCSLLSKDWEMVAFILDDVASETDSASISPKA